MDSKIIHAANTVDLNLGSPLYHKHETSSTTRCLKTNFLYFNKVNVSLEQAMKAQRESRNIALLFL